MNGGYEILGIGSPLIDYIFQVDNSFLEAIHAVKGSMKPMDYPAFSRLVRKCGIQSTIRMGGSSANTIKGLAHLGHRCALVGKVGEDSAGAAFVKSLKNSNVISLLVHSSTPTGQIACLVTSDGERTFRDFLGASKEFSMEDLKPELFTGVKLVHIEGYTLMNESVTLRAMELAKAAGAKVSFDLSNFELVQQFQNQIVHLLSQHVDIVFANRDETRTLTKLDSEKGCSILKDLCDVVVTLMGSEGCWIGHGSEQYRCLAYPVTPLDTTGAGDLFAAGFLHGYLTGRALTECAHYGALAGAAVVQVFGAEIPETQWEELRRQMSKE
jgi:sugar/nucleoside kinase (ribokinase family)